MPPFTRFFDAYRRYSASHPKLTNAAVGATLMGVGDTAAQLVVPRGRRWWSRSWGDGEKDAILRDEESSATTGLKRDHDWDVQFDFKRLATAIAWNGCLFSPFFFFWFRYLDGKFPGNGMGNVAKKVLINQAFVAGPINLAYLTFTSFGEELLRRSALRRGGGRHDEETTSPLNEGGGMEAESYVARSLTTLRNRINDSLMTILVASNLYWIPVNALNFLFVPPTLRVFPSILGSLVWTTFLSYRSHALDASASRSTKTFDDAESHEARAV